MFKELELSDTESVLTAYNAVCDLVEDTERLQAACAAKSMSQSDPQSAFFVYQSAQVTYLGLTEGASFCTLYVMKSFHFGMGLLALNLGIAGMCLYHHHVSQGAQSEPPEKKLLELTPVKRHVVLFEAANNGDARLVAACIKAGCYVDVPYKDITPIRLAAEKGHVEVCRVLAAAGADVSKFSGDKLTDLVRKGHVDVVIELIRTGQAPYSRDAAGRRYRLISQLAIYGLRDEVKALLDAGVKPDCAPEHLELACAILRGDETKVRELVTLQTASLTDDGHDPYLVQALKLGHNNVACVLIEAGAETDVSCTNYGASPVYHAASQNLKDVMEALLKAGASPNSSIVAGNTALGEAISKGHDEIAMMLMEAGAELNSFGGDHGLTPLMYAIGTGNRKMFDLLLEKGADENGAACDGFNAVMIASRDDSLDMLKVLVERGADINVVADCFNYTALLIAVINHSVNCARYLIEQGADVHVMDYYGKSLLQLCENEEIAKLLKEAGAKEQYPPADDM